MWRSCFSKPRANSPNGPQLYLGLRPIFYLAFSLCARIHIAEAILPLNGVLAMIIELPDTLNVYVKAIDKTFALDLNKVPAERVQAALVFGLQTKFGNARNGAGKGANKAAITPFIEAKVAQQYTAIELGTTGQRTVDPLAREVKKLATAYTNQWAKNNAKSKKDNAAEWDAQYAVYAAKPKLIAMAQAAVAALQGGVD